MLSLIVAMDIDRLIGVNGRIPWHLPDDMAWFKRQTMGKPIIMGRKTYQSIPARFRPLAGRHNIILTRDDSFTAPDCTIARTLDEAITAADAPEIMVIGGGTLYEQFLPIADRLYLTVLHSRFTPSPAPAYFPDYNDGDWQETYREEHQIDGRHTHPFTWFVLERK